LYLPLGYLSHSLGAITPSVYVWLKPAFLPPIRKQLYLFAGSILISYGYCVVKVDLLVRVHMLTLIFCGGNISILKSRNVEEG
jgi:hypothetical protein